MTGQEIFNNPNFDLTKQVVFCVSGEYFPVEGIERKSMYVRETKMGLLFDTHKHNECWVPIEVVVLI